MTLPTAAEKNKQFLKTCLGGGVAVLVLVLLVSFLQEFIKRKCRQRKLKRRARPPLCSSAAHNKTDDDCEVANVSIRNNLVIKKFESDMDETGHTMGLSSDNLNGFDSDIQSSSNGDTETSSEDNAPLPPERPPRSMSNIFRTSMRNLSEHLDPPKPKVSPALQNFCRLCNRPFENGDDICESSNPRCNHEFHQKCIQPWLTYQNTCPTCSEPFIILGSIDV